MSHSRTNIYFLSDFHLGAPTPAASLIREKKIIQFLTSIENDAAEIFILGDLFDFWFEYKYVIPKGFTRILGKLAQLTDNGIPVHFFVGNHDMWMKDYFQKELNIPVYFNEQYFVRNNKTFLIAHGDGLGPGDGGYKMMKKVFRNKACQWLFGMLPPVIGIGAANFFSQKSRAKTGSINEVFLGTDKEWLITYSQEILEKKHVDFFVFGHRHLPIEYALGAKSKYVNLGDWITYFSYAVFDGDQLSLANYIDNEGIH